MYFADPAQLPYSKADNAKKQSRIRYANMSRMNGL